MSNELTVIPEMSTMELGQVLAKSGFFSDARDASQAVVKVLAGREIGLGPVASMTGIYIVKGKPVMGANILAASVKRHPAYNYRVAQHTEQVCEIVFYEGGEEVGRSSFSIDDARNAGLLNTGDNWRKYPKNMLFARAISNGVKWHCPDVMNGQPVYTPDEMGLNVDGDGEWDVVDVQASSPRQSSPQPPKPTPTSEQVEQPAELTKAIARRSKLTEAFNDRWMQAQRLGLDDDALPKLEDDDTNDEIIEKGKALAAIIKAAEESADADGS